MDPDLWDVMHDSYFAALEGTVPGDVTVTISIEYLREMWADGGHRFIIQLKNCTLFEWHAWKTNNPHETDTIIIKDLSTIVENLPEIMTGAELFEDMIKVYLDVGSSHRDELVGKNAGWAWLRYSDALIKLDNGESVTLDDIKEKATLYWRNFGQ